MKVIFIFIHSYESSILFIKSQRKQIMLQSFIFRHLKWKFVLLKFDFLPKKEMLQKLFDSANVFGLRQKSSKFTKKTEVFFVLWTNTIVAFLQQQKNYFAPNKNGENVVRFIKSLKIKRLKRKFSVENSEQRNNM